MLCANAAYPNAPSSLATRGAASVDRGLYVVIYPTIADGLVQRLHVTLDPAKLEALPASRPPSPGPLPVE
jgi:hypothetical protein